MEKPVKRDVVVIPFPFSDLSSSKRRPALVIGKLSGDEIILCQITSKDRFDNYSVTISDNDFIKGNLPVVSNIRVNKLFTADKSIVIKKAGTITKSKYEEVLNVLNKIIND